MELKVCFLLFFALLILSGAVAMVFLRRVLAMLFVFLLVLVGIAGVFFLQGADFIGFTQMLIYVGGILLLLLFSLMFAQPTTDLSLPLPQRSVGLPIAIGLLIWGLISYQASAWEWNSLQMPAQTETIESIGKLFLIRYIVLFEFLAVLLTAILIGVAWLSGKK
jgi:NADH:ubiquinone oxidoreductase subunit 6 (subunit J)